MTLCLFNRRTWIASIPALLATSTLLSRAVVAETPLAAARVVSLTPLELDQPIPVVTALAVDPAGNFLAVAGDDKAIRIVRASDFVEIAVLKGHRDLIRTVDFRGDSKILVSGGNDGSLILWNLAQGYREAGRVDDLPAICSAKFSPSGKQIAVVGFSADLMIFGGDAKPLRLRCDCNDLRSCVYDRLGKQLAVVGRSGHVHLFDAQSGEFLNDFDLHAGRIRDCDFTQDGEHLVTVGEDGAAILFNLKKAEVVRRIDLLPCKLFALSRITETQMAVAGSDNRIRVVDFESGLVVTHLDGHRGSISTLVYANGSLFSGGFDTTLRRWPIAGDAGERLAEKDSPELPPKVTSSR